MTGTRFPHDDSFDAEDSFEPQRDWAPDRDLDDEAEHVELGVEIAGPKARADVRLPLKPVTPDETPPPPIDARELWQRVRGSLLQFIARGVDLLPATVETLHDGLKGAGGLLRIPQAIGAALTRTREKALAAEDEAQAATDGGSVATAVAPAPHERFEAAPQSVNEALDNLEAVIVRLQSKGVAARIEELPDGRFAVIAVRPELADRAIEVASAALANLELIPPVNKAEFDQAVADYLGGDLEYIDGRRVRALRRSLNLTQHALAEACGLSQPTISRLERGDYATELAPRVIDRLAHALNAQASSLLPSGDEFVDNDQSP